MIQDVSRERAFRIALTADGDATDRNVMSGTPFYSAKALGLHCGEVQILRLSGTTLATTMRLIDGVQKRVFARRYAHSHSVMLARIRSRGFQKQIKNMDVDVVFSAKDSKGIAFLDIAQPIVYYTDATFRSLRDYYPSFSKLYGISLREGELIEQRALDNASHVITPSRWAADSVIQHYGIAPEKVSHFPFGAKIDLHDTCTGTIVRSIEPPVQLLFIGREWVRKGGKFACQVTELLNARGVQTTMTVLGCRPAHDCPYVEVIPLLDKNSPGAQEKLQELYLSSHFLILPVRQEAAGSVFIEASTHGLPCLTNRTGGVPSMVEEGINGHTFDLDASPVEYADKIVFYLQNPASYEALLESTAQFARAKANWACWGNQVREIMLSCLRTPRAV